MASSHRQTNWNPVTFGATPLTTVQGVTISRRGKVLTASGDANFYPTLKRLIAADPMAKVVAEDETLAVSIVTIGLSGSLVATHLDAENQAGGATSGALTYTLSNSICSDIDSGADHQQLGKVTFSFEAKSVDGTTSPLALAVA